MNSRFPLRIAAWLVAVLIFGNRLATAQDTAIPPEGDFADINGFRMYYEVHGEGEPLVLLHGFFSNGQFWSPLLSTLAKEYRLIIPDLRNHGHSTNPAGTFTHRQSAKDVYALLDKLKMKKFQAMGFSTGGMTLLHMATSQPEPDSGMVLFGASTYLPVAARTHKQLTFDKFIADPQLSYLRKQHARGDDQLRELIRLWHSFEDSYDDMNFTPPYLSTIQANTLIVHGDRDKYFPVGSLSGCMKRYPTHTFGSLRTAGMYRTSVSQSDSWSLLRNSCGVTGTKTTLPVERFRYPNFDRRPFGG